MSEENVATEEKKELAPEIADNVTNAAPARRACDGSSGGGTSSRGGGTGRGENTGGGTTTSASTGALTGVAPTLST